VWNSVRDVRSLNIHQQVGLGVEYILKNSLLRRTLDNVTVVIVAFENFQRKAFGQESVLEEEAEGVGAVVKQRNPQMNNTHTSGMLRDQLRLNNGNIRTGVSTPTCNFA
jgi:hypothetical protein